MTDKELRQWCLEAAYEWLEAPVTQAEIFALANSLWAFIDRAHVPKGK
jgi:hypothetical protein